MIDAVCLGRESSTDFKMLKYIHDLSMTFHTVSEILQQMKKAPIHDKRYGSLHLFDRVFNTTYHSIRPIPHYLECKRHMVKLFRNIELGHKWEFPTSPFFNYRYLLQVIMILFKLDRFQKYIKPLKCKKRLAKYNTMFNTLKIRHNTKLVVL